MFLRNAEVIKHRAALRPMFYSKIVNEGPLKTRFNPFLLHFASVSEPNY